MSRAASAENDVPATHSEHLSKETVEHTEVHVNEKEVRHTSKIKHSSSRAKQRNLASWTFTRCREDCVSSGPARVAGVTHVSSRQAATQEDPATCSSCREKEGSSQKAMFSEAVTVKVADTVLCWSQRVSLSSAVVEGVLTAELEVRMPLPAVLGPTICCAHWRRPT